jgi:hypothetical protein
MGFFARRRARESAIPPGAVDGVLADETAPKRSALFDSSPTASEPKADPPTAAPDIGQVGRLIRSALEQGNVTVLTGDEVLDLEPAGLRGKAFDPVKLPEADPR